MNVPTGDAAELIGRHQLAAAEHYLSAREVESSGRRAAVRATNRHADELREIAAAIERMGSAAIERAFAVLEEIASGDSVEAVGTTFSLIELRQRYHR